MYARCLTLAVILLCPAALPAGDGKKDAKPDANKPLHLFRGTLDAKDPPDPVLKKVPHKVHEVQLEPGKPYVIDLESEDFDTFLRVEDAKGKQLAHNDGQGTKARLVFLAPRSEVYRVIATAHPRGRSRGLTR